MAVTAGWVERDGRIVPFPAKFPDQARALRDGRRARKLVEIANHGYTHCVMEDGLFRPRLFSGNRPYHREFYDWLPEDVHREHLRAAQDILGSWFGVPIETLVPPGNVLSSKTVAAAAAAGIRFISRLGGAPAGDAGGRHLRRRHAAWWPFTIAISSGEGSAFSEGNSPRGRGPRSSP